MWVRRRLRVNYRKHGLDAIEKDLNDRLKVQIRHQMEKRGYLKERFRSKRTTAQNLLERTVWIHHDIPRPDCWDHAGETPNVSLEKLLAAFPVLDEITQKAVLRRFDSFLDSRLALYRKIPLRTEDWEPVHNHIAELQHALGAISAP